MEYYCGKKNGTIVECYRDAGVHVSIALAENTIEMILTSNHGLFTKIKKSNNLCYLKVFRDDQIGGVDTVFSSNKTMFDFVTQIGIAYNINITDEIREFFNV